MLLVQKTINGTVNKISTESHHLASPYYNYIFNMDSLNQGIRKAFGGYFRADIGGYTVSPLLFENDWPPPVTGTVTMQHSSTTEAAAETFFTGTYHRAGFDRESVNYDVHSPQNSYVLPSGEIFNDTLVDVLTWFIDATRMNLTLDSTLARNPSPAVIYTTSGERLGVDFLDDLTAFFSHMYYISGGTLYLMDMASNNGSRTLTEHDFFAPVEAPVDYFNNAPLGIAKAGNYSQQSAYLYGNEITETAFHNVQGNIETALADIVTYQNKDRARLAIPFIGNVPVPGEKLSWTDTSLGVSTDMWIRARIVQYNFGNEQIIIEGEGAVAAT